MLHHNGDAPAKQAEAMLLEAMVFSDSPPQKQSLIRARIAPDGKET
jgi:hypothetical protein